MLTVHIVSPGTVALHGALQRSILKSTSVIVDDSKSRSEAQKLVKDAVTLSRHKDVVAVVPASRGSAKNPQVSSWLEHADEAFEVSSTEKNRVKFRHTV